MSISRAKGLIMSPVFMVIPSAVTMLHKTCLLIESWDFFEVHVTDNIVCIRSEPCRRTLDTILCAEDKWSAFVIATSSFITLMYGYKQRHINVVDWIRVIFVIVRVSKNVTIKVYEYKTALLSFTWSWDCVSPQWQGAEQGIEENIWG